MKENSGTEWPLPFDSLTAGEDKKTLLYLYREWEQPQYFQHVSTDTARSSAAQFICCLSQRLATSIARIATTSS